MRKLICSAEFRLGQRGLDDFKAHPWFAGIDWETIREGIAPYIPEVSSPTDTSNFDVDDNDLRQSDAVPPTTNAIFTGLHLPFVGFTFTQKSKVSDLGNLGGTAVLSSNATNAVTNNNKSSTNGILGHHEVSTAYENKILAMEKENMELQKRLNEALMKHNDHKLISSANTESKPEVRKLQDEINILTKKNYELENLLALCKESKDLVDGNNGANGDSNRLRELEKMCMQLKLEKDELQKECQDCQEKLKMQTKEVNDALKQRELAMSEYTEISDKLSDLRQQKQKLSRQVRDKEEELEVSMQKIDSLRQDIRRAEKLRREMETRIDGKYVYCLQFSSCSLYNYQKSMHYGFHKCIAILNLQICTFSEAEAEASKERRLRERSEEYCKQMEEEMERFKQRQFSDLNSHVSANSTGQENGDQASTTEILRLKGELERVELEYKESLLQTQSRYTNEITSLKDQILEAEVARDSFQKEANILREKVDHLRLENLTESEETITELKRIHDREKSLLLDDNKRLVQDLDKVSDTIQRLQGERRALEDEYEDLRIKKESIAHWESQIAEVCKYAVVEVLVLSSGFCEETVFTVSLIVDPVGQ